MKIGFLVSEFPQFSETFLINQVVGLLNEGHDVQVFSTFRPENYPDHSIVEESNLHSRTTYVLDSRSEFRAAAQMCQYLSKHPDEIPRAIHDVVTERKHGGLRYVLKEFYETQISSFEFDAFHAHFGPRGVEWNFVVDDVPLVVSFYGRDASTVLMESPNFYSPYNEDWDEITVLSHHMRERLLDHGFSEKSISKVPLIIDTDRFTPREDSAMDGAHELLSVGRFVEKKGFKYAIKALGELKTDVDYRYRIAGDGPLRDELRRIARQQGVAENVEFLGRIPQHELRNYYQQADMFLAPSVLASDGDEEGTPTVLLEAQASGTAVLSTYHAGIPEIVEEGISGRLVTEGAVEELAETLETMLEMPKAELAEMGMKGRRRIVKEHDISVGAKRLEDLYQSVQR
jgi:colanic acid/amylovoran biosynthesis glycosyltransferase